MLKEKMRQEIIKYAQTHSPGFGLGYVSNTVNFIQFEGLEYLGLVKVTTGRSSKLEYEWVDVRTVSLEHKITEQVREIG